MQIELVITAATLAVAVVGSIAGIFGMNLNNRHEDSYHMFLVVRSFKHTMACVLWFFGVKLKQHKL